MTFFVIVKLDGWVADTASLVTGQEPDSVPLKVDDVYTSLITSTYSNEKCGDCPMFRRFYVQKIFVQKVLCSEGSIFRRFYVQNVLCSENIQKVLYSENSLFDVGKNLHLSVSGKLQCKITNHSLLFQLIR